MKTSALAVTLAFLVPAAGPVFAQSHQEQIICAMTAGNCLDRAKIIEKRIMDIKTEIAKNVNVSPEEAKKLDKKLQDTMGELKRVEAAS
ncbi:MAG: hypothetical protein WCP20_09775 [Desulfuromonadales bacterium]